MAENEQAPTGAAKPLKTPEPNTTLADRAKAKKGRKRVSDAEDKSVASSETKRTRKA